MKNKLEQEEEKLKKEQQELVVKNQQHQRAMQSNTFRLAEISGSLKTIEELKKLEK